MLRSAAGWEFRWSTILHRRVRSARISPRVLTIKSVPALHGLAAHIDQGLQLGQLLGAELRKEFGGFAGKLWIGGHFLGQFIPAHGLVIGRRRQAPPRPP